MPDPSARDAAIARLVRAGRRFDARGWVPASGGNFSARLDAERFVVTASGWHKGELDATAFLDARVADGLPVPGEPGRPSYETGLHAAIYRRWPAVGAVLHTHSVANTVLSRRGDEVLLDGYELLKVLPGITTHAARVVVPVFDNDQDIPRLAATADAWLARHPGTPAYLIRGHGLYAWHADAVRARYAVEALEFMFDCELHATGTGPAAGPRGS